MGSPGHRWKPSADDQLGDRWERVRRADESNIAEQTIGVALAAGVAAIFVLGGRPFSTMANVTTALVAIAVGAACGGFFCNGLYLSRRGVRVWRFVRPLPLIPWHRVERFELAEVPIDLGRRRAERIAVRTTDGSVYDIPTLMRYVGFERGSLPVESEKAWLRTYPLLIEHLNHIRRQQLAPR